MSSITELISKRGENFKTFLVENDGNAPIYRLEVGGSHSHYKDDYANDKEQWKDCDPTIRNGKCSTMPYELTIDGNIISVRDKKTGNTSVVEIKEIGGKTLKKGDLVESEGKLKKDDVDGGIDFELVLTNNKIKFQRTIKDESVSKEAKFKISGDLPVSYHAYDVDDDEIEVTISENNNEVVENFSSTKNVQVEVEREYTDEDGKIKIGKFIETQSKPVKYPIKIDPTLTIQGSGADTWINGFADTTNYGSETYLQPYYNNITGYIGRALVNFSLSGVPAGAVIDSATFSLYYYDRDTYSPEGDTFNIYKVRRSDWVDSQATWNIYKTSNNWGTAGCNNTTSDIDTSVRSSAIWRTGYGWQDFDVKDIVEDAIDNGVNFNVRISASVMGVPLVYSKDYTTDTSKRPKLVIDYTVVPDAPTNVSATENNSSKVVITWTKSSGATNYAVLSDGDNISGTLGDVATYDDTVANPPVITAGTASATEGDFSNKVVLSLSGQSIADGTSYSYTVKAYNAAGWSSKSSANAGYRKASSLSYQWQVSAGDSDASYSDISGATTNPYDYTDAPAQGRYYKCKVTSTGAEDAYSSADRYPLSSGDFIPKIIII